MNHVVVLGGGAAGLAAAAALARAGKRVVLLEARRRWGGRIWTRYPRGAAAPVELGAEFVHGRPPEIVRRAAAHGLPLLPVGGDWRLTSAARRAGPGAARGWDWEDRLARLPLPRQDRSFQQWLEGLRLPLETQQQAYAFISGFHAADPSRISLRSLIVEGRAERQMGGGQGYRLAAGYRPLIAAMVSACRAAGVVMQLGVPVSAVRWRPGAVLVRAAGRRYLAEQAVITLPLPVLRGDPGAAPVRFSPPLTSLAGRQAALRGLAMGQVERLVLCFRRRWWQGRRLRAGQAMGPFLFAAESPFRAWWLAPAGAPQITAWAAGPAVETWPHATAALEILALGSLAAMFGVRERQLGGDLIAAYRHDWRRDPWAAGAYTYALVGCAGAFARLAEPAAETLFFAGEATESEGHHATVHGALASGERAAREVLAAAPH